VPQYVGLPGSKRTLLPNSRPAGPIDPSEITSVTVRVRSTGNKDTRAKKAYDLANMPLAKRKYLTREQLEKQFGASQADLDKVEHLAQEHNLTVVHRSAAEKSIVLRGKLGDLLSAFQADVGLYHHAMGTYRGRQGEIAIPVELSKIVTGVFGFDTRPKHRALRRQKTAAHNGPGGKNGVAATEFAKRYNFPTGFDGTGQTIAIIELGGGYRNSDLKVFFQEIGVPAPQVSSISVDHAGNNPTTPDSTDGDQRRPSVISMSWGSPESSLEQQSIDAYHELFAEAAMLGITVCAASGDHGTADLDANNWDGQIHVDHPACDDLVLGCGGTQIDGSGVDVVWNDGTPLAGGGGWASGGGISEIFPVPSYQADAKLPVSIATGKPGRGVPDIAMSATNYFIRVDSLESASGGTSAVAPLMAALVALLNQAKKKNVGFLNPFLYANAAKGVVNDVTMGTNTITPANPMVKGYNAGPGWDACSGLGTPDGTAILKSL
jgi:kumamolisin